MSAGSTSGAGSMSAGPRRFTGVANVAPTMKPIPKKTILKKRAPFYNQNSCTTTTTKVVKEVVISVIFARCDYASL